MGDKLPNNFLWKKAKMSFKENSQRRMVFSNAPVIGDVKGVANIHMLYTPSVSNNITLTGDDRLKSNLPEQAFITNLSCAAPSAT